MTSATERVSRRASWERPVETHLRLAVATLLLLCATGVSTLNAYNLIKARDTFDVVFVLTALGLLLTTRSHRGADLVALGLVSFVLIRLGWMWLFGNVPVGMSPFIQSYKSFVMLALLAAFVGRRFANQRTAVLLVKVVLFSAVAKYLVARLFSPSPRIGSRPGLFTENNFELSLFCLMLIAVFPLLGKQRNFYFGLLVLITILSGSRSGAAALVPTYIYLYFGRGESSALKAYVNSLGVLALGGAAIYTFQSRLSDGGFDSIDRVRFFRILFSEMETWSGLTYLFGSTPMSSLSLGSCRQLIYYQIQLGETDSLDTCYSVVLHSYVMRVVFDTGIFGLVIALSALWYLLRRGGCDQKLALTVFALTALNGLSVSALNDALFCMGIAMILLTRNLVPQEQDEQTVDRDRRDRHGGAGRYPWSSSGANASRSGAKV